MSAAPDFLEAPAATGRIVEGMLVPFDQWLEVDNSREGNFMERWAAGSLRKSFSLLRRLRGYMDHGRSQAFGRAPVMDLLEAWETDAGAFFRAELLDGVPGFIVDGIRKGLYAPRSAPPRSRSRASASRASQRGIPRAWKNERIGRFRPTTSA